MAGRIRVFEKMQRKGLVRQDRQSQGRTLCRAQVVTSDP